MAFGRQNDKLSVRLLQEPFSFVIIPENRGAGAEPACPCYSGFLHWGRQEG